MTEPDSEIKTNWVQLITVAIAAIGVVASFFLQYLSNQNELDHKVLENRKEALFLALDVINKVYANSTFNGNAPLNPKEFDINLARQAVDKMLIYCKKPEKTVKIFYDAIGIRGINDSVVKSFSADDINKFRRAVSDELDIDDNLSLSRFKEVAWIYALTGTIEGKVYQSRLETKEYSKR